MICPRLSPPRGSSPFPCAQPRAVSPFHAACLSPIIHLPDPWIPRTQQTDPQSWMKRVKEGTRWSWGHKQEGEPDSLLSPSPFLPPCRSGERPVLSPWAWNALAHHSPPTWGTLKRIFSHSPLPCTSELWVAVSSGIYQVLPGRTNICVPKTFSPLAFLSLSSPPFFIQ